MTPRMGIVGAGSMAAYHIAGFRDGAAEVTCIADPDTTRAKAAAEQFGISSCYASADQMLASEGDTLDAVSIITPNRFHRPLAIQALEAGKHVFCEKPPALNAAEMQEMKAGAERAGRLLVFDFNNRARPESFAMMDYIRQGVVGRINSAQAIWIRRTGIPGFGGWFTNKAEAGGGPLIDLLHMVDLGLYFMGYPQQQYVLAQTFDDFISDTSFKGPWGIPDVESGVTDVESACHAFVRFTTGQVLFLRTSWAEMNHREEVSLTFQGAKAGGTVRRLFGQDGVDDTATDCCQLYVQENGRSVNRDLVFEQSDDMGRRRTAENFALAVQDKEPPLSDPAEALALMKLVDAVYASAASGKPVEVT